MKQLTLNLDRRVLRPIAELNAFHGFNVLIDTGADFPVWIEDKEVLEKLGAVSLHKKV